MCLAIHQKMFVLQSLFTRVGEQNVHLSQHWINNILMTRAVITNLLWGLILFLKGLRKALSSPVSPVGVHLYVWLCLWWRFLVCFLSTCRQSCVATPVPKRTHRHGHHRQCGNKQWQREDVISSPGWSICLYYTVTCPWVTLRCNQDSA